MGWADWPARLQHLAPGPLVGEPRGLARRRPQSFRCAADRDVTRSTSSPTASRCTSSSPASRPRTRRACSSRSRASSSSVHTVPIPDHGCFSPDDLAEIAGELGFAGRRARQTSSEALAAVPQDARVLIFGSLYLAGRGARSKRPGARLGASPAVDLRRGVRLGAPAFVGDPHPFEDHEQHGECPAAAVQRKTVA